MLMVTVITIIVIIIITIIVNGDAKKKTANYNDKCIEWTKSRRVSGAYKQKAPSVSVWFP